MTKDQLEYLQRPDAKITRREVAAVIQALLLVMHDCSTAQAPASAGQAWQLAHRTRSREVLALIEGVPMP